MLFCDVMGELAECLKNNKISHERDLYEKNCKKLRNFEIKENNE